MGRHLVRLTAAAVLAALLVGCGSSPPPAKKGISVRVDGNPFRITILRDGETLVAENEAARLRYRLTSGAEHRLTKVISSTLNPAAPGVAARLKGFTRYRVATDEQGRTAEVFVGKVRKEVSVLVSLEPASGVRAVYDSFDTGPDDHFLGGGEVRTQVDLRGAIVPIKVSTDCGYAPVPYFASTAGWALRLVLSNVSGLAFPGSPGGTGCRFGVDPACAFPALEERAEVCVTGATLAEMITLGTFDETLAAFQAATYPPPVPSPSLLALIKWRDRVEGPQQVLEDIARFRAAGIPLGWVLLDNPWETCVGSLTFDRSRIPDPAGLIDRVHALGVLFMLWISPKILCNPGYPPAALVGDPADQVTIDLRRRAVIHAFERRLSRLATLGVDGLKADRGDEIDLEPLGVAYPNTYPYLYAAAVSRALPDTPAIFRAATDRSKQLVPGLWAGDQDGTFDGLREAIHGGLSVSMSGFTTWGSDVGGYRSEKLTEEVFARWAQFGAVSPIMEVGGIGANATPWTLGRQAMSVLEDAAILHYELFPYLYGLLERHQPVLRPLGYAYPGDPESWKAEYEFLVGRNLLAAPVIGPGTTPSVYLPQGSWIDLYTGVRATGGQVFTRQTPLGQFPFYVREGAAVPFNLRTATDSWWGVDEQTHPGRAGWLTTNLAHVNLDDQPRDVQIFVPASERPLHVSLGGEDVAWTWNPGPLPGVVVRVHGPTVRGRIVLART